MLFMNIVDNIAKCAVSATSGPEDMMPITLQVFESITRMIRALPDLLTQAWKIPDLTDLWEDLIGQGFSILNLTTYSFALLTILLPPVLSDTQVDAAEHTDTVVVMVATGDSSSGKGSIQDATQVEQKN
jgi:hypothetical protein